MVCVTPEALEPAVNVPDDARDQVVYEITDEPLELALPTIVLLKAQLGLVFKVKASVVPYVGVPLAVSICTISSGTSFDAAVTCS